MIRCICLRYIRDDFAARAERCFNAQCYSDKVLSIADTRKSPFTIGVNRNLLITGKPCDYIAHWDFDDVSAPNRLSCQLAHIQKTGKLVSGFFDMPMYDEKRDRVWIYENPRNTYALGTSLFYKREAWEKHKFPDRTTEDNLWRNAVGGENIESRSVWENGKPLMIQVVHGGNASASIISSSHYYKEPSEAQEKAVRELLRSA